MKYADFKDYLKMIMAGDKELPTDPILKPFLLQSLKEVARFAKPLLLTTKAKDKDILMALENGLYILTPKLPLLDDDEIVIGEDLIYAVAYKVASKIADIRYRKYYEIEANKISNDYVWNRYTSIENGNYEDQVSYTESSLDTFGFKTIYKTKVQTSTGIVYDWDDVFINLISQYLIGTSLTDISKSDKNNLEMYISFSNGTLTDPKSLEDFTEFNKYLGGL